MTFKLTQKEIESIDNFIGIITFTFVFTFVLFIILEIINNISFHNYLLYFIVGFIVLFLTTFDNRINIEKQIRKNPVKETIIIFILINTFPILLGFLVLEKLGHSLPLVEYEE